MSVNYILVTMAISKLPLCLSFLVFDLMDETEVPRNIDLCIRLNWDSIYR